MVPSSGRLDAGDVRESRDEPSPFLALGREHGLPGVGDSVVAPPALARSLDPAAADETAFFEAIQRGVQRGQREPQRPARAVLDVAGDVVTMQRTLVNERQNQEVCAAFFAESIAERSRRVIYRNASYRTTEVRYGWTVSSRKGWQAASLDGPTDPDAKSAWDAEIQRRIEAIEAGTIRLEPWDEVKRRIERDVLGR